MFSRRSSFKWAKEKSLWQKLTIQKLTIGQVADGHRERNIMIRSSSPGFEKENHNGKEARIFQERCYPAKTTRERLPGQHHFIVYWTRLPSKQGDTCKPWLASLILKEEGMQGVNWSRTKGYEKYGILKQRLLVKIFPDAGCPTK